MPGFARAGLTLARSGGQALAVTAVCAAIVAGSALLGLLAGLAWTAVAPHALLVSTGGGGANVVNPETSAFIVADGWFGLLGGGVAAALIARWVGQRSGQAAFGRQLAVSRPGALLQAPVSLGAHGAIAFWPLAAGFVVGGIETIRLLRDR